MIVSINGVEEGTGTTSSASPYEFIPVNVTAFGTNSTLITKFTLPAGTYSTIRGFFGTINEIDSANLSLAKADGTTLGAIAVTGSPVEYSQAITPFTLAVDTEVQFYILGSTGTTISILYSVGVK